MQHPGFATETIVVPATGPAGRRDSGEVAGVACYYWYRATLSTESMFEELWLVHGFRPYISAVSSTCPCRVNGNKTTIPQENVGRTQARSLSRRDLGQESEEVSDSNIDRRRRTPAQSREIRRSGRGERESGTVQRVEGHATESWEDKQTNPRRACQAQRP